ncbi:MAG: tRNA uridine-5-carboxymethylaminomethyl(34) synthesis GTPase MnmE [Pseudomonadota bacterium]
MPTDQLTIFAVSSGAPPAAIGVIRISGPMSETALTQLTGRQFTPRRASLAKLKDVKGKILDEALILWLPGPNNATGEDCAELHCHGGRAVLAAVEKALSDIKGLRSAQPGEFTRRAFANGRIDLAEAEGLADLLSAETELQRAAAIANSSGVLSREVENWRSRLLCASAQIEAALDFSDEDDVDALPESCTSNIQSLSDDIAAWLQRPRSDRLGAGVRVVLAGPPNAGKSTLFNALVESEAAITSDIAGTTRDVIERSVGIDGIPFVFVDTAGLREDSADAIEAIGINRANTELERADIVLWLGDEGEGPSGSWEVASRLDATDFVAKSKGAYSVSAKTNAGVFELKLALGEAARQILPKPGEAALNARQHAILTDVEEALNAAQGQSDVLLIAEELRRARIGFDKLVGKTTTEDMLDALFGRFCIGK